VAEALQRRDYPGNLRDLRHLAHRVAARHVGAGPVTPGDLPPADRPGGHPRDGEADPRRHEDGARLTHAIRAELRAGRTLKDLREHVAEVAVAAALEDSGGNVRAAASRLGVTERALHLRRAQRRG
jgi:DNA-binding NtrC family response regulator